MILVRAPLRISFVGGGTDLPNFYKHYPPGCVISTTIDKFVYVGVNKLYRKRIVLKYSLTEDVAKLYQQYVMPTYTRTQTVLVRGKGIKEAGDEVFSLFASVIRQNDALFVS